MVASFGRREPAQPPVEQATNAAAVTPLIQAIVVPTLSQEALESVADEIRMSVADAVLNGFRDGVELYRRMSEDASAPAD